jgi:hypothetical protein
VFPGETVLALDGVDMSQADAKFISKQLRLTSKYDRFLSFLSPPNNNNPDEPDDPDFPHFHYQNLAEDDSSDAPFFGKLTLSSASS